MGFINIHFFFGITLVEWQYLIHFYHVLTPTHVDMCWHASLFIHLCAVWRLESHHLFLLSSASFFHWLTTCTSNICIYIYTGWWFQALW
jgi:hypothetical protein